MAICHVPTIASVTNITFESATINWTSNGSNFEVEVKAAADAIWNDQPTAVAGLTYTFAGLNPSTEYQFRVRQDCDTLGYSDWAFGTKGDLSENAEYDAAKEAQGLLEARISKLQALIANARVLDESKVDISKVLLLSRITIRNVKTNMKQVYLIVPESESNLKEGKISVTSPFAQAFLGRRAGDTVEVKVPAGTMTFEILTVER
ncbi:MAG: GreA/GreB family elongation factor [Bacteroidales bacterium]|nr:GreA/GreB family elongation factor [Bacteroidales bacterium]